MISHDLGRMGLATARLHPDPLAIVTGRSMLTYVQPARLVGACVDNPAATAASFREGGLQVLGRTGDILDLGGIKVHAAEMDQTLRGLPGVADAMSFDLPVPGKANACLAFIVPAPGATIATACARLGSSATRSRAPRMRSVSDRPATRMACRTARPVKHWRQLGRMNWANFHERDPATLEHRRGDDWFHPGDLARWKPNGRLTIVGRLDQIINRGRTKVDLVEIEDVLHDLPGVQQAAVLLVPHEQAPQGTMAFLMLDAGADMVPTIDNAISHCGESLGGLKAPGYVFVVPEIPMTLDGVPRRGECARIARTVPRRG
jgi:acyl-coenzyme A synthetase/AMP-(fatty) acid ligase